MRQDHIINQYEMSVTTIENHVMIMWSLWLTSVNQYFLPIDPCYIQAYSTNSDSKH